MTKRDVIREAVDGAESSLELTEEDKQVAKGIAGVIGALNEQFLAPFNPSRSTPTRKDEPPRVLVLSHEENHAVDRIAKHLAEVEKHIPIVIVDSAGQPVGGGAVPVVKVKNATLSGIPVLPSSTELPYPELDTSDPSMNLGPVLNARRNKAMKKALKKQRQADRPSWRKP